MPTVFFAFMRAHWASLVLGAVAVGVVTTIEVQHLEVKHLRRQVADLKAEELVCEGSVKKLEGAVDDQNAALQRLSTSGVAKAKAAAVALSTAEQTASSYASEAARLKARPRSADVCRDMEDSIDEYFKVVK